MSDEAQKLTNKQRAFVEAYLTHWNASKAARDAGYSVRQSGHETLSNPVIQEAIKQRLAEKAMSADEVLVRLAEHARGSIAAFLRTDGTSRAGFDFRQESAQASLHLIKKYAIDGGKVTLELYDAQAALVHIGRHHGLFVDKTALTDPTGTKPYDDADAIATKLLSRLGARPTDLAADAVPDESEQG